MASNDSFRDLGLSIIGVGSQYPPYSLPADSLAAVSRKFYPETPAMKKVLAINQYTGIEGRASIGTPDHPLVNQEKPPTISELHEIYLTDGVPLAVKAARKAVDEAKIDLGQITHVVSTTCTNSANPGFDHYLVKELGLTQPVEKVLLHGVGCSGGLASLRTAANLALGHRLRGKPARILCVALEVSTTMARSELESIHELQETRIGCALFSDCASAVVLSNGLGEPTTPVYDLLGWDHRIIPDTEKDLGFDVHPQGWKVVLTPRVPKLTGDILIPTFTDLLASLPPFPVDYKSTTDFDWAMHPGGSTILLGAQRVMGISAEHMRASYDTYMKHGNSSSATIFSVLDRLRCKDMDALAPGGRLREYVVGCAFGPGISVEMCMLKRNLGTEGITGLQTPPETESEGSRSELGDEADASLNAGNAAEPKAAAATARGTATATSTSTGAGPKTTVGSSSSGDADRFLAEALDNLDLD